MKSYEVIPVTNKYTSEVSFGMDENELLKIYKYAESSNISVVGIFHSHPSKPVPSETDKVFMEINPVPWIIKSTITDEMRCFVFSDVLKGKIDGIEEIQDDCRQGLILEVSLGYKTASLILLSPSKTIINLSNPRPQPE